MCRPSTTRKPVCGSPLSVFTVCSSRAEVVLGSACRECGPCQSGNVGVRVGMPLNAPAAFRGLGDEYPGPLGQRWVPSRGSNDLGQLLYDAELLVSIENVDRSENLDSHVLAVSGCVRDRVQRQLVNESRGVIEEQWDCGHSLPTHNSFGEILSQLVLGRKCAGRGVNVNHRHGCVLSPLLWLERWSGRLQLKATSVMSMAIETDSRAGDPSGLRTYTRRRVGTMMPSNSRYSEG